MHSAVQALHSANIVSREEAKRDTRKMKMMIWMSDKEEEKL